MAQAGVKNRAAELPVQLKSALHSFGSFCLLSPVSCLSTPVSCLLPPGSCLLSSVFCLLSSVFCLLSPVFCLLSPVFCLLSPVSCPSRHSFPTAQAPLANEAEQGETEHRGCVPERITPRLHNRGLAAGQAPGKVLELVGGHNFAAGLVSD